MKSSIESTADKIQTLKHNSENIGTVLEVIRTIAEQTNLLALNAAIAAAQTVINAVSYLPFRPANTYLR